MTRPRPILPLVDPPAASGPDVAELEARLREAEETLDAIRNGEVDAVVVGGPSGQQVYTLENADRPYRVLIEQMQEGAVTLSADGTILYCNQRFAAIVGRRHETVIGDRIDRFLGPAERDIFHELLDLGPGAGISAEFTLSAGVGGDVPVNVSLIDLQVDPGMARVICGVVTDLSTSRRRSHELSAANARLASEIEERRRADDSLRLALEATGMGSWDIDLASGIARRSLRHDRIFGYPTLQPVWSLQTALAHFLAEDREALEAGFAAAPEKGAIDIEGRIRRAGDGAVRWLHIKGQTHYADGKAVRIAGVVADITDRRAVEEQLRQAQKMEAVGQLTGGIAHDFNNLLMIIGGSLDMLARRVPPDEKTGPLFEAARQGVARGAKLNQQLLAFSRRQDLRVEVMSVDDLIPNFEHLLDRAVGETITVAIERGAQDVSCRTDPHQLETAILNLAINARDAMPDGGTLTIATHQRTVSDWHAAAWGAEGGEYVVVSVTDTGAGMSPDVASRAFEPFFTTKDVGRGTGLGLSQVYGFAKQSDGFVTIESERGRGTTVAIHLPATSDARTVSAPIGAGAASVEGGDGIVLVVEDDPDVRATAGSMLRDLGYTVREVETAAGALALLESGAPIDLVFSDVIMPGGMSGIELARELGVHRPDLPVLLTSGYTAQRTIADARADDLHVLRKPYTHAELSQAITAALRGR